MNYGNYTTEEIDAMRWWLVDVFEADPYFDIDDLSDREVLRAVRKYYYSHNLQDFLVAEGMREPDN